MAETRAAPYKGATSYEPEDYQLFFGREHEARAVSHLVLSTRASVICAPSGAGKTSLLNARVFPMLEAAGWLPVRIRVTQNPMRATRQAALLSWVVQPLLECKAIDDTLRALAPGEPDVTLGEIVDRFNGLAAKDATKRRLIAPVEHELKFRDVVVAKSGDVMSFFSRLLRGTLSSARYGEHVGIGGSGRVLGTGGVAVGDDTPVSVVRSALASDALARCWQQSLSEALAPAHDMAEFFTSLWSSAGNRAAFAGFVLIFDQFEELFTLFRDAGTVDGVTDPVGDWRLRWQFFQEFDALFRTRIPFDGLEGTARRQDEALLPLRFVFSLRDEFLGQLGPLRETVEHLDDHMFRLEWLSESAARQAIREPARLYGYDYAEECFQRIIRELIREGRFIEPPHVQIVCDKLWRAYGERLAVGATADPSTPHADGTPREISAEQFETEQGGAAGILGSYLGDYLATLPPAWEWAAVEMLVRLVTSAGTRNSVEYAALVEQPFRDATVRARVLSHLEEQRIVRIDPRLGGRFVEITHEFLIASIRSAHDRLLASNPSYRALLQVTRILERRLSGDFRSETGALPTLLELDELHEHRDLVPWGPAGVELMLRASIVHVAAGDRVRHWAALTRDVQLHDVWIPGSKQRLRELTGTHGILTRSEWGDIERARNAGDEFAGATAPVMLRSSLRWADARQRESIVYWTKAEVQR